MCAPSRRQSQEAVLASGIELLPLADARGDPRGGARRRSLRATAPSAIVAGDRRQLAGARHADRGRHDRRRASTSRRWKACGEKLKQLTESNARTLDQLAAGVAVFGKDGRILFHNAAFRAIWDLSRRLARRRAGGERHPRPAPRRPETAGAGRTIATGAPATSPPTATGRAARGLWHLPDGRTLRVVAVPNSDGGMTYIYENVTEQITLESRLEGALAAAGRDARPSLRGGGGVRHRRAAAAVQSRLRRDLAAVAGAPARASRISARSSPNCQAIYSDKTAWDAHPHRRDRPRP